MKVNIYDVAKKAGVSVVTVSRVINNVPTVRERNRQKVLDAMQALNYQPNAAARSLARGRSGVIGLVIPKLSDPFMAGVAQEINSYLARREYYLALSIVEALEESGETKNVGLFQEDRVDGLLILTPLHEEEYIVELKAKGIPFVLMDNQRFHAQVPSVIVDNVQGGYAATKHLIDLGHRAIAHIGGPKVFLSSKDRESGFCQALSEASVSPFAIAESAFSIQSGYSITNHWLEEGKIPTAIFAADDHIAFGAIDAIREKGLRVPDDISVVGYDDHPFAAALHPLLTTVKQPSEAMGRSGVELLLELIGGNSRGNTTVKLEPKLIVRHSTAAPRL